METDYLVFVSLIRGAILTEEQFLFTGQSDVERLGMFSDLFDIEVIIGREETVGQQGDIGLDGPIGQFSLSVLPMFVFHLWKREYEAMLKKLVVI